MHVEYNISGNIQLVIVIFPKKCIECFVLLEILSGFIMRNDDKTYNTN